MHRLLILVTFFISSISIAQDQHIDQKKLDSLKDRINQQSRQTRAEQEHLKKLQDSIYYTQMERRIAKSTRDNFDYYRQLEAQHKRQMYIRIGVGALFLVFLVLGLIRKRKKPLA